MSHPSDPRVGSTTVDSERLEGQREVDDLLTFSLAVSLRIPWLNMGSEGRRMDYIDETLKRTEPSPVNNKRPESED